MKRRGGEAKIAEAAAAAPGDRYSQTRQQFFCNVAMKEEKANAQERGLVQRERQTRHGGRLLLLKQRRNNSSSSSQGGLVRCCGPTRLLQRTGSCCSPLLLRNKETEKRQQLQQLQLLQLIEKTKASSVHVSLRVPQRSEPCLATAPAGLPAYESMGSSRLNPAAAAAAVAAAAAAAAAADSLSAPEFQRRGTVL
ncbi:hypothetical protein Esti_001858 [Eimeria stiedai]